MVLAGWLLGGMHTFLLVRLSLEWWVVRGAECAATTSNNGRCRKDGSSQREEGRGREQKRNRPGMNPGGRDKESRQEREQGRQKSEEKVG